MLEVRPRFRPAKFGQPVPYTLPVLLSVSKGELVRYFAWGYLSRRELNERLRRIEVPREQSTSSAA
jgi:hypothetical protein